MNSKMIPDGLPDQKVIAADDKICPDVRQFADIIWADITDSDDDVAYEPECEQLYERD